MTDSDSKEGPDGSGSRADSVGAKARSLLSRVTQRIAGTDDTPDAGDAPSESDETEEPTVSDFFEESETTSRAGTEDTAPDDTAQDVDSGQEETTKPTAGSDSASPGDNDESTLSRGKSLVSGVADQFGQRLPGGGDESGDPKATPPNGGDGGGSIVSMTPDVFRRRLLTKLFLGLFAILLISGLTAGFFYIDMDGQLQEQVETQNRETANLQSDVFDAWFVDRQRELVSLGEDPTLTVEDRDIQSDALESALRQSNEYVSFHMVEINTGEILASSHEDARGESLFDRAPEEQVSATEFVTNTQYSSYAGDQVIAIGAPLGSLPGEILVGEVNATAGGPTVRQTTEGAETVVVDESGGPVVGPSGVPEAVVGTDGGNTTVEQRGDSVYATAELSNGLYLVTESPSNEVFALRQSILQSFLITLVVTFAVLSVIIGAGGRSIERSLQSLATKAQEIEKGNLSVDLSTNRIDEIGGLYGSFDSMRDSLQERISEAETALENAEQARAEAENARREAESAREEAQRINEQIEQSAANYSDVMEQAANGDLTVRMTTNEENQAMAAIADDFNEMIDEFELVVGEVKQFAESVTTASQDVTASSEEVRSASEQVSRAIQGISEGAVEQNEALQETRAEMNDLSATIQEIAASSNEVAQVAKETAKTSQDGQSAAEDAIEGMEAISDESEQAVEEIADLEAQVEQVDDLIARISEIADQTSILALNANIEAARASGDGDGDGFTVVAQEVKTLSEDAKEAADEIEQRLEAIRNQTETSAEAVQTTSQGIQEQTDSVKEAAEAFRTVADNADETNHGIQEISTSTDRQAATTDQVVSRIDEVAEIADQTTTEAENTTATAEEQTAAITHVSESASELSDQAMELSEALDRFQTDSRTTVEATDDD